MELKLSQSSSLPSAIFNSSARQITLLAQRWKLEIRRISWKGHDMSKKLLVHVVKEGETLTSISKLYGVPVLEIAAANKDIANVDLVFKGQCLNIPSALAGYAQVCHFDEDKLHKHHQLPNAASSLGFHSRRWNQILTVTPFHRLPLAKTTGTFLVLVPLIALCIRCIMGALQNIVARNLRHKAAKNFGVHQSRSKSMRWKTVLSDLRDPNTMDANSEPDSDLLVETSSQPFPDSEDQEQMHFEDTSQDYTKLEGDYQQFLSECGMSNWGYWRGGSPK